MDYFLGIPLSPPYASRIEAFRREIMAWSLRPQRSEPHISVKGGAGLDDSPETTATVEEIAACRAPFSIKLGEPAIFEGEPVLYLSVVSPGWSALHRTLVDTIAARTGETMHPLEIGGWIPHLTVIRVKRELLSRQQEILSITDAALSPFPTFTADTLRMYRQERNEGPWLPFRDVALSGHS